MIGWLNIRWSLQEGILSDVLEEERASWVRGLEAEGADYEYRSNIQSPFLFSLLVFCCDIVAVYYHILASKHSETVWNTS